MNVKKKKTINENGPRQLNSLPESYFSDEFGPLFFPNPTTTAQNKPKN